MDRRHRALLRPGAATALVGVAVIGGLHAQPAPSPGSSATPWVQASSPPPSPGVPPPANAAATPPPTVKPTPAIIPLPPPKPAVAPAAPTPATPKPAATPAPTPKAAARPPGTTPAPSAGASADETKAKMLRERERELNQAQEFEQLSLMGDEQTTFRDNARLWNKLPPGERRVILGQAGERIREETEQAYEQSGLSLNDDQREVFALRYRQERRRLERELLEKANNERNRRMPQILESLKREFGRLPAPGTPKASATPAPTPPPSPSAAVNAVPTPAPAPPKA